jgi:hypothetical protein
MLPPGVGRLWCSRSRRSGLYMRPAQRFSLPRLRGCSSRQPGLPYMSQRLGGCYGTQGYLAFWDRAGVGDLFGARSGTGERGGRCGHAARRRQRRHRRAGIWRLPVRTVRSVPLPVPLPVPVLHAVLPLPVRGPIRARLLSRVPGLLPWRSAVLLSRRTRLLRPCASLLWARTRLLQQQGGSPRRPSLCSGRSRSRRQSRLCSGRSRSRW